MGRRYYYFKKNIFSKNNSINYGTTSEFHKAYYKTNEVILKNLPKYFIISSTIYI